MPADEQLLIALCCAADPVQMLWANLHLSEPEHLILSF